MCLKNDNSFFKFILNFFFFLFFSSKKRNRRKNAKKISSPGDDGGSDTMMDESELQSGCNISIQVENLLENYMIFYL